LGKEQICPVISCSGSKDSLFTNLILDNPSVTDTLINLGSLDAGMNYYWHVLSNNNTDNVGGYSGYTDTWSFSVSGTTVNASDSCIPTRFAVSQNYPNPFNPSTKIKFDVPKTSIVKIKVYNDIGEEIKTLVNNEEKPGTYEVEFDGNRLASGIYFYNIQAESPANGLTTEYFQTKKMILIK
jgi:hypothetical protein